MCCNEDEWKETLKKEYEKSIEAGNVMIFMCFAYIIVYKYTYFFGVLLVKNKVFRMIKKSYTRTRVYKIF